MKTACLLNIALMGNIVRWRMKWQDAENRTLSYGGRRAYYAYIRGGFFCLVGYVGWLDALHPFSKSFGIETAQELCLWRNDWRRYYNPILQLS